jgi:hypothetical protein
MTLSLGQTRGHVVCDGVILGANLVSLLFPEPWPEYYYGDSPELVWTDFGPFCPVLKLCKLAFDAFVNCREQV